jgi:SAM-dependent methyltransferase
LSVPNLDQPPASSVGHTLRSKRQSHDRFQRGFDEYQEKRRTFWNGAADRSGSWGGYYHARIEACYRNMIPAGASVLEIGCGRGDLLAAVRPTTGVGVDFSEKVLGIARARHPGLTFVLADAHELAFDLDRFDYIIFSDVINDLWDVQTVLARVRRFCSSDTRLVFNYYSHLWHLPLRLAQSLGLATPTLLQNWLTRHDVENLLEISGYQPLRGWEEVVAPLWFPILSHFANRYLSKLFPFRFLALSNFLVARPLPSLVDPAASRQDSQDSRQKPASMVSVVVPARNESGHIDELLDRIPEMYGGTEIIFVEGNSTDNTYEKIQDAIARRPSRNCKLLKQSGKGKGDAVRAGFAAASGDILMILDADITVPPEDLPRFAELLKDGTAEFVNGVRLVYPMDESAMRFANLVANKAFSWAFSWLLGQPIRDTLCGTKVLWKKDYDRIARNRAYFGEFDPFGDFDLLFGAARLNLKIVEVPVRYCARRYGETNIQRWRHGLILLKMVLFAARRLKFV